MKIFLNDIKLFGYHGLFEHERIIGNWFVINMELYISIDDDIKNLHDTVDYGAVYDLVKELFSNPHYLLESLATTILKEILQSFLMVQSARINIRKDKLFIEGFSGSVSVEMEKKRT